MKTRVGLSRALGIAGTALAALPLVAVVVLRDWTRPLGNIDWLIPAELFPLAFVGGALLVAAAILARRRRWLVIGGFALMLAALGAGMLLSQVSGLAEGLVEPAESPGWWGAVIGAIAVYTACLAELSVAGVLLCVDLFRHRAAEATPPGQPVPTA